MSAEHKEVIISSDVRSEEISTNKMICALSAIALEMQKYDVFL